MKTYRSGRIYSAQQVKEYTKTHKLPYRTLAYRDFPTLTKKFAPIHTVLDVGTGTGCSANYLHESGYNVVGVDSSPAMLQQSRTNFPHIPFFHTKALQLSFQFDLAFSCFMILEQAHKQIIINHFNQAAAALKDNGIFFAVTASEELYNRERNWAYFNVDYSKNTSPSSGNIVKASLKDPAMNFYDFFWTENDCKECFEASNLKLLEIHHPLGLASEPYPWADELTISPFVIFIAQKIS
ncbi:hypothetical protein COB21_03450 [Candidatus Aerophobetes bacterium]|uniref:Methyltransferase domain-containing protein n=1 Tax=Aerophobetes bacterium TaxID=2030807 RepID=A0A2A4X3M1_UNCAE|nr:MAG: hypothetical protein COB21_03450 [Candidatus Aerophobetes bacterium]